MLDALVHREIEKSENNSRKIKYARVDVVVVLSFIVSSERIQISG